MSTKMKLLDHLTHLNSENLKQILDFKGPLCISVYMPTHRKHPENQQDSLRFSGLIKKLEDSLKLKYTNQEISTALEPLHKLEKNHDFWNHTLDGIAILAAPDFFKIFNTPQKFHELAISASSFHVKPLLRFIQTVDQYHVLALGLNTVKLFEGTQHDLTEVTLAEDVVTSMEEILGDEANKPHLTVASYGGVGLSKSAQHHGHGGKKENIEINTEKFFREVDRSLNSSHFKDSKLPLILAALPEYHSLFKKISHNPKIEDEGVHCNPEAISLDDLQKKSWNILEPKYQIKIQSLIEEFTNAQAKKSGSDEIQDIAKAAVKGQVQKLIIESAKQISGQLDANDGHIQYKDLKDPETDDLLDDLAQLVLSKGGEVIVLKSDKMPSETGLAAIYRYIIEDKTTSNNVVKSESSGQSNVSSTKKQTEIQKDRAANEGMNGTK
jgi:hypothetical protein